MSGKDGKTSPSLSIRLCEVHRANENDAKGKGSNLSFRHKRSFDQSLVSTLAACCGSSTMKRSHKSKDRKDHRLGLMKQTNDSVVRGVHGLQVKLKCGA